MHILLYLLFAYSQLHTGLPGIVDYSPPSGYQLADLPEDSTYTVLLNDSGAFTVVPLLLRDTLDLPVLPGWNAQGDTMLFQPPLVTVVPSFPDTMMTPSVPVYPCYMDIPPGLPEDYARDMSFWLVWKEAPPFPWLWVTAGLIAAAALAWYLLRRRRNTADSPVENIPRIPAGKEAEKEALALLEAESYLHGRWPELYGEINRQLRTTVAGRFGIVNRALTLSQISRKLAETSDGRKFLEASSDLINEIIIQVYADWGSTREKTAVFIRKLASLRKEWSR